jgi:phenylalanyl-tRNA synthetase alpha chain
MLEDIEKTKDQALKEISGAVSHEEVEKIYLNYLGRKGKINLLIKHIKTLDEKERRQAGQAINEAKNIIEKAISDKQGNLIKNQTQASEWFDLTIPGKTKPTGNLHAQTKVLTEILKIFNYLGYQVADGPEIEKTFYNFEILNFPKDHPARDAQQTMFFDVSGTKYQPGELIPRTHTSAMQGRIMEKAKPPFRVVVPGRCFRYEQVDASHGVEFWQVEGFVVDKNVRLTDLFGTLEYVLKSLFGESTKIKFATTFFPFVEPGVDTYIECTVCKGAGCSFCKNTGWSEIMPAGMIHPFVLEKSNINANEWKGFAFAIGLSRVVTLKYQINDLRILHTPDMRILTQF